MKTIAIVQARTNSSRLPCKIFAGLKGRPMLAHVLERAAAIQGVDQVVLAVPENDVKLVAHLWPHVYGGSEKDVLGRYAGAAERYEADVIVRVTGDCPLLSPGLVSSTLITFNVQDTYGYAACCQPYSMLADGWDHEVFTIEVLNQAIENARKDQREHVTTWMREYMQKRFDGVLSVWAEQDWTALKCSVDSREDLQRVEQIMNHLDDPTDFSHQATWQAWERAGRP